MLYRIEIWNYMKANPLRAPPMCCFFLLAEQISISSLVLRLWMPDDMLARAKSVCSLAFFVAQSDRRVRA